MAIEVQCIQCGSTHQVNDRLAGRTVRCPECDTAVHVPEVDLVNPADEVAAEIVEVEIVDVEPDSEPIAAMPVGHNEHAVGQHGAGKADITPEPITPGILEDEDSDAIPRRKPREDDELDMTPMVDVTFLLLIFFMVTASFSLQKSVEMPRQQSDAQSHQTIDEDQLETVEVQIDDRGSFLVMAKDWERETPGKQNLTLALKSAMTNANEGMKLIITVHEMAKLQYLVDAMDSGTIAGFTELQVTQVDGFD
ncbi:colicin uptake protein TolR [Planctomycetes bacterium CA13]|uniref:Colicin uptake protein TolR n=1 Tax=Novipirellula herctigrandis TaxID=2527986 RepID=A0A5C5Z1M7_9BACT|nr:colicin uptake protein TolR [Planctomycetes bacterium CA13]